MNCQSNPSCISIHNGLLTLAEVATRTNDFMNEDKNEDRIKSPSQTYKTKTSNLNPQICVLNEIKSLGIKCDDQVAKSNEVCEEKSFLNLLKEPSDEIVVKRKKKFPEIIMDILSSHEDTITWLPRGNAFAIIDKEKLINNVVPLYFKRIQYRSFVTRLYRWGFKRFIKGQGDCKIFYHENFLRDSPRLCAMIYINRESTSNEVLNGENNYKQPHNEKEEVSSAKDKELLKKTMEINSVIHPQYLPRYILTANNHLVSLESENSSLYVDKLLHGYFNRKMSQIRSHYFPKTYHNPQA